MRVDYQFSNGSWTYLHYKQFRVKSSSAKYQLIVGAFTGVGKDEFAYHNKLYFSTPDNDNDNYDNNGNCASKSGWWYNSCDDINFNKQPTEIQGNTIFSEMKIRPKDYTVTCSNCSIQSSKHYS